MGTIIRKVEPIGPMAEILHIGGCVNYSLEIRAYLARIPKEQAERIVAELEYQHRPRKIVRLRTSLNPPPENPNDHT